MKTCYYLGWFNDFFPTHLADALSRDVTNRHSLVMISSDPASTAENGVIELSWLQEAGILFNDYHVINYETGRTNAKHLLKVASMIFLLDGDTVKQNQFIHEYDLIQSIQQSEAIVIGASAGAINMSLSWLCPPYMGYEVSTPTIFQGVALNDFSVLSHFDLEHHMHIVKQELALLSEELPIYLSNKDCALRVQGDQVDIFGDVYLYANRNITKLPETTSFHTD
ncbi:MULTISPECIES: Type 1 glutamine amidotransferase-like domain-containing protein [unclassified Exiguobacterium]|uniref:Type 1 glutamine amidotransferase-like domain-containing protein n=1 Tax=unclassified Exiguobacterium TaxID=2644629 RepID=UPI001BECEE37|nr:MULTISPECIES: Type 1 glutamine amidotransferase-like domain-containing protein [unclassified Exiguobacterium]